MIEKVERELPAEAMATLQVPGEFEATEARVIGRYPDSQLVVLFTTPRAPERLLGWAAWIWGPHSFEVDSAKVFVDDLQIAFFEYVGTRVEHLQSLTPDEHGVSWVSRPGEGKYWE